MLLLVHIIVWNCTCYGNEEKKLILKTERIKLMKLQISMMLADLGGHAGLWLGLSVVSVVECLALVGMLVLFCLCGAKFKAYHAKAMRKDEEVS